MTWEKVKSLLLSILVSTSLLLTLAIWNYQPEYGELEEQGNIIDETTKVSNGSKQSVKNIIQPKQIIFHHRNRIFSPEQHTKSEELYTEIRTWPMSDFQYRSQATYEKNSTIEIVFPAQVPIQTLTNLLNVKESARENIPKLDVDRLFIQMSQQQSSSLVYFASSDSDEHVKAEIQNFDVYSNVEDYLVNPYAQKNYVAYTKNRKSPIYLPASPITLPMNTYPTRMIDVNPFINVLFNNPNLVKQNSSNVGEEYYSDGTRGMRIYESDSMMEYINPVETEYSLMNRTALIRQSLEFVNDHNGWTDQYNMYHISQNQNYIRYRLIKDGYPVFNKNNKAFIAQRWRNQEIFEYQRSLIQLLSPFGSQEVTLRSGSEVIAYLEENWKQYPPYLIEDIAIGYQMGQTGTTSSVYTLEPSWFIKLGDWQEINFDEELINQGGSG